jgi:Resolvase, N terminal domain
VQLLRRAWRRPRNETPLSPSMIYGYARVSTDGQSLDAQVKQLRAAGAEKLFRETASGARADRAQLRRVIAQLAKGDVLTVTRASIADELAAARAFRPRADSGPNRP